MDNSKKNEQNQIPIKCEICDKEFKKNYGLKRHFNTTHNLKENTVVILAQNR